VYDKVVKDHSVGDVRLDFLRLMNLAYLIALEEIWL